MSKEINFLGKQSGNLKPDHPISTRKWTIMLRRRISLRERRVGKELRNIQEESCYHHIECSAPNQLTPLMWK